MKKQYAFLLTTTDCYEFAMSCCDTLSQMSKETGIPFCQLWNSFNRNETCCGGRYKVHKVDIITAEDKFNFEDYKEWCKLHNLKLSNYSNLLKYKRVLNIYIL